MVPVPSTGCWMPAASGDASHTALNSSVHPEGCSSSTSPPLTRREESKPTGPFPPLLQCPRQPPSLLSALLSFSPSISVSTMTSPHCHLYPPPPRPFYLWIPKQIRLSLITYLFVGGGSKLRQKAELAQMLLRTGFLLGYTCLLLVH